MPRPSDKKEILEKNKDLLRSRKAIADARNDAKRTNINIFEGIEPLLRGTVKPKARTTSRLQLEQAPNQIIFIESPQFLEGPRLHYEQYAVVRDFFELLCPFCNDIERVQDTDEIPREEQILLEFGVCPKCGFNKLHNPQMFTFFNELIGVVGMRSGKSVMVACITAAMLHDLLCTDDLQERLGLVKSQIIDGAFVAASGEQASETIYGHFRGLYDNSPWFQDLRRKLLDLEIVDPELRRGDLYWETDKSILFKEKKILIKSLTSNSGSIAGKTRIFAVIDELARMDSGDSKRGANEVYRVLKRSLLTIRASVERLRKQGDHSIPDARMFCISSPMFEDDKAMQLLKQAEKAQKMFAFHRPTWEFNPDITKEDLADEFATDPIGAERDYGANPPGAETPFIHNKDVIDMCIDVGRINCIASAEKMFDETIRDFTFKYIRPEIVDIQYKNLFEYVIHCDPGQNDDSFCLAIGHKEEDVAVIDGALECRPIPKNNRQGLEPRDVYFPALVETITYIASKLTLKYISYDRWNSTEQIQRLRLARILAFQRNLSREDHVRFLNSMLAYKVRYPSRENDYMDPNTTRGIPCAKALWELRRLSDNGVKVDHPPGGSNDMIQCYVGVHRLLMHAEDVVNVQEIQNSNRRQYANRTRGKIGQVIRLPVKGMRR